VFKDHILAIGRGAGRVIFPMMRCSNDNDTLNEYMFFTRKGMFHLKQISH